MNSVGVCTLYVCINFSTFFSYHTALLVLRYETTATSCRDETHTHSRDVTNQYSLKHISVLDFNIITSHITSDKGERVGLDMFVLYLHLFSILHSVYYTYTRHGPLPAAVLYVSTVSNLGETDDKRGNGAKFFLFL